MKPGSYMLTCSFVERVKLQALRQQLVNVLLGKCKIVAQKIVVYVSLNALFFTFAGNQLAAPMFLMCFMHL